MNFIFTVVYSVLRWMSDVTGLSYNEINIIVFYLCIPAIFLFLIDRIIKRPVFAPSFIILSALFFVFIPSFREFSDRLFALSVDFRLWFSVIGWSYTVASVVICVLIPILIFIPTVHYAFPQFYRRCFPTIMKFHDRLLKGK